MTIDFAGVCGFRKCGPGVAREAAPAAAVAAPAAEAVVPTRFASTIDVKLTPLPCLQHLTDTQRQAEVRHIVAEIKAKADADNKEKGRTPMTVAEILAQDPHSKPGSTDRSPAPFVHATEDSTEMEFRAAYRAFVDAFRAGVLLEERSTARSCVVARQSVHWPTLVPTHTL
jgi:hypothetical protein